MSRNSFDVEEVLIRYLNNNCTPAEAEELFTFLEKDESNRLLLTRLKEDFGNVDVYNIERDNYSSRIRASLQEKVGKPPVKRMHARRWLMMAASAIIFIITTGGYLFFKEVSGDKASVTPHDNGNRFRNDISPAKNKPMLILADGQSILLDSVDNGTLTKQGSTKVLKLDNDQLSYYSPEPADQKGKAEVLYNTIIIPPGGQYQLVLPDGTKTWLNASSSMRFPVVFTGQQRIIELTGEAYFEVQKDASRPFLIKLHKGGEVEVTGTRLNIMAYDNEPEMTTTLIEGVLQVKSGGATGRLRPGQQAQVQQSDIKIIKNVDIDEVIAWKNGLFDFNNADITYVMRQLSRWYDVEVQYKNGIPDGHYTGSVHRKSSITAVLKMLELAGDVHFEVDGKNVTVFQNRN